MKLKNTGIEKRRFWWKKIEKWWVKLNWWTWSLNIWFPRQQNNIWGRIWNSTVNWMTGVWLTSWTGRWRQEWRVCILTNWEECASFQEWQWVSETRTLGSDMRTFCKWTWTCRNRPPKSSQGKSARNCRRPSMLHSWKKKTALYIMTMISLSISIYTTSWWGSSYQMHHLGSKVLRGDLFQAKRNDHFIIIIIYIINIINYFYLYN